MTKRQKCKKLISVHTVQCCSSPCICEVIVHHSYNDCLSECSIFVIRMGFINR